MKKTLHNKKGFTLAELLIVVAIIAVLVAIAIPIFSSQLEKAKEATDAANIRAAYAEVSTEALTDDATTVKSLFVTASQTKEKWQTNSSNPNMEIGGIQVEAAYTTGDKKGWVIAYDSDNSKVTITPATDKGTAKDYPSKS